MTRTLIAAFLGALLCGCTGAKLDFASAVTGQQKGEARENSAPQEKSAPGEKSAPPAKAEALGDAVCKGRQLAQQKAERAIVTIKTKFSNGAPTGFGAGIVLSAKGSQVYILTADHVVKKAAGATPHIEVSFAGADGAQKTVQAQIFGRFTPPPQYPDLAILQVDAGRLSETVEWDILRELNLNDLSGFVAIGNPAGAGITTTTPGAADFRTSTELHINAGVMQPGYSGGGVFDAYRRLAGIVFEDRGQYAAAYPIDPVLAAVRSAGVPVDLKIAPAAVKREVSLSDIEASTPELKQAAKAALGKAMKQAGFEPFCPSAGGYKLSVLVKSFKTSQTTATIELLPTFLAPGGGSLQVEKEEVTLTFFVGFSPLSSPDELEVKLMPGAENLVTKLTAKIG